MKIVAGLLSLLFYSPCYSALTSKELGAVVHYATKDIQKVAPQITKQQVWDAVKIVITQSHIMPDAITIGGMARCQDVIGGCYALQANFTVRNGKVYVSMYELYGVTVGLAAMTKIEVYVSACYGGCIDDNAQGYFMGADAMAALGAGGGVFMDVGADVTDLLAIINNPINLWKARTIYIGYGFDIGEGAGVSVGMYYYRNIANFYLDILKGAW